MRCSKVACIERLDRLLETLPNPASPHVNPSALLLDKRIQKARTRASCNGVEM
jgi:hypothetical protein